ncbi:ceramide glucosyltransferase [Rhodoblastus sp. 17X3]|uniref:ceramide glucosyltransferase n=1 Tax=Rhodoblastus sp. 17X3 TaxID=3047026 RepID=UPI0024B66DE0|nr:ceramide glucosyltransferase [Rhodoblastus sp. 17X3]MDI9846923.1 ceramide glucosyltransferase [Rhodoblastus sp. 17X3]
MTGYIAAAFCLFMTFFNAFSLGLAGWRCRRRPEPLAERLLQTGVDRPTPPVSIVRPVCGLETFSEETLRSTFELDHPEYEVLFCVQKKNDPIIPLIEKLLAGQPEGRGRLLIGDDPISPNPKLNNCFKGWQAAQHQWIVLADSNVLAPKDYLQQMLVRFRPDIGLVCSPPLGVWPDGFRAQLECAFLNTFQARWQFCADAIGMGFAQGKSMMWRREIVEQAGGVAVLASEIAEDAAATKLVRNAGMKVALVDRPFGQPLGKRTLRSIYQRQTRWARLRRASFPSMYAPEILAGSLLPILAGAYAARDFGFEPWTVAALVAAAWQLPETLVSWRLGWPTSPLSPLYFMLRDLLFPIVWIDGWLGDDFVWLGNSMSVREGADETVDGAA